jgi:hypothetical protein
MQALRALSRVVLSTVANPSRTLDDVESITKWLLSPGAVHLLLSPAHADTEFILALAYHMHVYKPCLGPCHSSPALALRNPPSRRPLASAWRQAHPRALARAREGNAVWGLRCVCNAARRGLAQTDHAACAVRLRTRLRYPAPARPS